MSIYAVIGLGRLGAAIATHLWEQGAEVIGIDISPARVDALRDQVTKAVCLDATDERALRAAGVADCSAVALALGEQHLEQAVLTTMLLRDLGVGRIVARAATEVAAKVLDRLGVSRVVFPERQIGIQVARQILSPLVHEMIPIAKGTSLAEIDVPRRLVGKTLGELQLRRDYGLNAVALRHRSEAVTDDAAARYEETVDNVPGPETTLCRGDVLVVVGADDRIRSFADA